MEKNKIKIISISEKLLNDNGFIIKERPHRTIKGHTEDWMKINNKEYQTSYASWNNKTLIIWDDDENVTEKIREYLKL